MRELIRIQNKGIYKVNVLKWFISNWAQIPAAFLAERKRHLTIHYNYTLEVLPNDLQDFLGGSIASYREGRGGGAVFKMAKRASQLALS